eukprot:TRINITY_DN1976_c0_g1_i1.p1 TRINITY_DN1976_c0_g1~~TRINITY_DN1976_c0_g1_i1.p1  ORF type:complete len:678 (+),score=106.08 TRINITY_DN1976_c0_g1_i1:122-2155(+)
MTSIETSLESVDTYIHQYDEDVSSFELYSQSLHSAGVPAVDATSLTRNWNVPQVISVTTVTSHISYENPDSFDAIVGAARANNLEKAHQLISARSDLRDSRVVSNLITRLLNESDAQFPLAELLQHFDLTQVFNESHCQLFLDCYTQAGLLLNAAAVLVHQLHRSNEKFCANLATQALTYCDGPMMELLLTTANAYQIRDQTTVWRAVFSASAEPTPEFLQVLLRHGLDVNYVEPLSRRTPLLSAVRQENFALAAILIQCGADVNAQTSDRHSVSSLMQLSPLREQWLKKLRPYEHLLPFHRMFTLQQATADSTAAGGVLQQTIFLDGHPLDITYDFETGVWRAEMTLEYEGLSGELERHTMAQELKFSNNKRYLLTTMEGHTHQGCSRYQRRGDGEYEFMDRVSTLFLLITNTGATFDRDAGSVLTGSGSVSNLAHIDYGALTTSPNAFYHPWFRQPFPLNASSQPISFDHQYIYTIEPDASTVSRFSCLTKTVSRVYISEAIVCFEMDAEAEYLLVGTEHCVVVVRTATWTVMRQLRIPVGRITHIDTECRYVRALVPSRNTGAAIDRYTADAVMRDTVTTESDPDSDTNMRDTAGPTFEQAIFSIPYPLSTQWTPERHYSFPVEFRQVVRCLLLVVQHDPVTREPRYANSGNWLVVLPIEVLHEVIARLALHYV